MQPYKFTIEDKTYKNYKVWFNNKTEVDLTIDFTQHKLFHEDRFDLEDDEIKNVFSPMKQQKHLSGILVLSENKTYGRHGKKMLHKCVPDSRYLPIFLIPYKVKNEFDKNKKNMYVTFAIDHWDHKHPYGRLINTIGPVDILANYYEYQLYCKSLNASIQKFTKETSKRMKMKTEKEYQELIFKTYPNIVDKTKDPKSCIYSIDPEQSKDFDDAIELIEFKTVDGKKAHKLCIYISNVTIWMEVLKLWGTFSTRIATIYLPDRRRPMLPTCLSECLCSLVKDEIRFAITCEFTVIDAEISNIEFYNSAIKPKYNFVYEEDALLAFKPYQNLLELCKEMIKKNRILNQIRNSHDVVAYLMILMNAHTAKQMTEYENGIYRLATMKETPTLPDNMNPLAKNFITIWNSNGGKYVTYDDENMNNTNNRFNHEMLKLKNYMHITSPIRRLVDLLNLIQLQKNLSIISFSEKADHFMISWFNKLNYINETMKAIRKIQTNCNLLNLCQKPEVFEKIYKGILFDKIKRNDGIYQYNAYIYEINMVSKLKSLDDLENYKEREFKLYYFKNEHTLKQKIKIVCI